MSEPGDVTVISTLSIKNAAPAPIVRAAEVRGAVQIVSTYAAMEAIPAHIRVAGLIAYVEIEHQWYQLYGGITNSDWISNPFGAGGSPPQTAKLDKFVVATPGQTEFVISESPLLTSPIMLMLGGVSYSRSQGLITAGGVDNKTITWVNTEFSFDTSDVVEILYWTLD